jgi:hypothetical protein
METTRRDLVMSILMGAVFVYALVESGDWSYRSALFPQVIGVAGLLCIAALLFVRLALKRVPAAEGADGRGDAADEARSPREEGRDALRFFGWLAGVLAGAVLIGQLAAMPLFVTLFLKTESRLGWRASVAAGAITWAILYGIFEMLLQITWIGFP